MPTSVFADLKPGDRLRIGPRTYTVGVVDQHADLVELNSKGSKRLITLMPHAREAGKYVLSSARMNRVIDSFTKL